MNAMQDLAALAGRLRATVRSHATRPFAGRIEQLTRLRTLLDQNTVEQERNREPGFGVTSFDARC
jgi:hypothetical protein